MASPNRKYSTTPLKFIAAGILLLALMCALQFVFLPGGFQVATQATGESTAVTEIRPVTGVRINEVMSKNRTAWAGANGRYPDWVELYNAGNSAVDITGWTLTDRANRGDMFVFPEHVLESGDTVVICMTGLNKNSPNAAYQAAFGISAAGDTLMLYDADGTIMHSINVPALNANQVYAQADGGDWVISSLYTPGLGNSEANHQLLTIKDAPSNHSLVISEIVAENRGALKDEGGDFSDYIELTNTGIEPIPLTGYAISDDPDRPQRYTLPDVTVAPGESLIIFASGKDKYAQGGEIHANFKLNAEGETVVVTDLSGQRVAAVTYELLRADQAYLRNNDGTYTKGTPSPGAP